MSYSLSENIAKCADVLELTDDMLTVRIGDDSTVVSKDVALILAQRLDSWEMRRKLNTRFDSDVREEQRLEAERERNLRKIERREKRRNKLLDAETKRIKSIIGADAKRHPTWLVPRQYRPDVTGNMDHGSPAWVLCKFGSRALLWEAGAKYWSGRGSQSYSGTRLTVVCVDERTSWPRREAGIVNGGSLSKALIKRHIERIAVCMELCPLTLLEPLQRVAAEKTHTLFIDRRDEREWKFPTGDGKLVVDNGNPTG